MNPLRAAVLAVEELWGWRYFTFGPHASEGDPTLQVRTGSNRGQAGASLTVSYDEVANTARFLLGSLELELRLFNPQERAELPEKDPGPILSVPIGPRMVHLYSAGGHYGVLCEWAGSGDAGRLHVGPFGVTIEEAPAPLVQP